MSDKARECPNQTAIATSKDWLKNGKLKLVQHDEPEDIMLYSSGILAELLAEIAGLEPVADWRKRLNEL